MSLLPFGLLLKQALLLTRPPLELALLLAQAFLLLPGLRPATIEQCQTQGEHGIDVLGSPMHAWPFQTSLHHELVTAFHAARSNWPTRTTVGLSLIHI